MSVTTVAAQETSSNVVSLVRPRRSGEAVELSVVIPFYNPGPALRSTVSDLLAVLRPAGVRFEVVAVSDGSTDGSESSLEGLGHEVVVLRQPRNTGKGAALHRGFARAKGAYVGFVDADGDISPQHVLRYFRIAQAGEYDVVYADKRHGASVNRSTLSRKVVSLGFSSVVACLFRLGVRDTQTGCKVFSKSALAHVLPVLREQRFAFDLEFFVAAKSARITSMVAVPVQLEVRTSGSSVSGRAVLRTLRDALTIYVRRARGQYACPGFEQEAALVAA